MLLAGLSLITIYIFALTFGKSKGLSWHSDWSWDITVKDGTVDSGSTSGNFMVDKEDTYSLEISWTPSGVNTGDATEADTGFVSACVITDEKGNYVYAASGLSGKVKFTTELNTGAYNIDYYYFTNANDYTEFSKTWLCGEAAAQTAAAEFDFDKLAKDGTYKMNFSLKTEAAEWFASIALWIVLGLIVAVILTSLIILAVTKGRYVTSPKYDERQELERGNGMRYAFFTTLIALLTAIIIDSIEIIPLERVSILYMVCFFVGIAVYVVYCIWHDCYFALNENRTSMMIFFALIGAFNLLLSLNKIRTGEMIENGRFAPTVLNLFCAILMLILFIAVLGKKIAVAAGRSEADEDEDM